MFRQKKIESLGTISQFLNREHEVKERVKKESRRANKFAAATTASIPFMALAPKAFAAENITQCSDVLAVTGGYTQQAVTTGAGAVVGKATVATLTHALDPIFQLLTALAFPVCGLVIVGSLFYLAFGNSEKAWSGVQRGALAYILIQLSPMLLKVLEQIGNSL